MSHCPKCRKDLGSLFDEGELCPACCEARNAQSELSALKSAIKQGDTTIVIDGGDMTDHGWTRMIEHNLIRTELRKALLFAKSRIVHLDSLNHPDGASVKTLALIDAALAL